MRAYDYWWGYTIAQIELMACDTPIVRYSSGSESTVSKRNMDALADRWAASRNGQTFAGRKVKLSELLNPNPQTLSHEQETMV